MSVLGAKFEISTSQSNWLARRVYQDSARIGAVARRSPPSKSAAADRFLLLSVSVQIWLGVRLFHVLCCTLCEVLMYRAVKQKLGR